MTTFTRSVLKALSAAALAAAVLIFIFAFAAYKSKDPSGILHIFGMTAFLISCFVGGAVSRRDGGNILNSLVFAGIYIFILFAISLIFNSDTEIIKMLFTYLGGVAAAVVGGIFFAGKKGKKPKGLKKYKKHKKGASRP